MFVDALDLRGVSKPGKIDAGTIYKKYFSTNILDFVTSCCLGLTKLLSNNIHVRQEPRLMLSLYINGREVCTSYFLSCFFRTLRLRDFDWLALALPRRDVDWLDGDIA